MLKMRHLAEFENAKQLETIEQLAQMLTDHVNSKLLKKPSTSCLKH